jgi:hypothetical protein
MDPVIRIRSYQHFQYLVLGWSHSVNGSEICIQCGISELMLSGSCPTLCVPFIYLTDRHTKRVQQQNYLCHRHSPTNFSWISALVGIALLGEYNRPTNSALINRSIQHSLEGRWPTEHAMLLTWSGNRGKYAQDTQMNTDICTVICTAFWTANCGVGM